MANSLTYAIKRNGKYLQGITPNEHYSRSGTAPTMGARHCFHEYKSIWGSEPKTYEMLTAANYLKIIFEEFRWDEKKPSEVRIIPVWEG